MADVRSYTGKKFWMGAANMTIDEAIVASKKVSDVLSGFDPDEYYTDDNPKLCLQDSHYVFIYDNMKQGFSAAEMLDDEQPIGVAYTMTPWWKLYRSKKAIVPIVENKTPDSGYLYGELYQVPTSMIRELDYEFSNGCYYKRLRIPLKGIFPREKPYTIYAFMYVGIKSYWEDKLPHMKLCDIFSSSKNKSFRYYNYLRKYENENES